MKNKSAIIMLAWPETPAIQVGSWYEPVTKLLGFNKNGYYTAGHSALVLLDPKTGGLHYFDFGRYHTPSGYGRIRNADTDPDLIVQEKAEYNHRGEIKNVEHLLLALSKYKSFHGHGHMFASISYGFDFYKAFAFAKNQQKKDAILYGPFAYKGTNCSRFTSGIYRTGVRNGYKKAQTILPLSLTPTPIGNVLIASEKNIFYKVENSFVHKKQANIFSFLAHWTLPPIKAVPFVFNKKKVDVPSQKLITK